MAGSSFAQYMALLLVQVSVLVDVSFHDVKDHHVHKQSPLFVLIVNPNNSILCDNLYE